MFVVILREYIYIYICQINYFLHAFLFSRSCRHHKTGRHQAEAETRQNNWILVIHEPAGLDHSANMLSDHSFNNCVSHVVFLESGTGIG